MPIEFKPQNISPQGRPKVFFTCHPDDFDRYFEALSNEILETQTCTVFYYDPTKPEPSPDERAEDLQDMKLFVLLVTTSLLTKPSTAMDFDFPFATGKIGAEEDSRRIPVLPIAVESIEDELAELYHERFEDLQYLDKTSSDPTAIPYEEKFKKYLKSSLVGDETAERIRAAFDAYIFLSYRKKDRKLAGELMKIIHSNDFLRNIAIWYDEFLTPGEDFNENIRAALEKSKLFTLLVTPSLLEPSAKDENEDNYVVKYEYPAAVAAGKKILPTEMEKTDRKILAKKCKNIPKCTDPHAESFQDELLSVIKGLNIKKKDDDPEHNFLIGMAYLNGIDVETNHERAVKMITAAAEANHLEAIEKLAFMYKTGDGVERNYYTAVEWQSRLVEICRRAYEKSGSESDGQMFVRECIDLGDFLTDVGKLNEALKAFEEALSVHEVLCRNKPDEFNRQRLGLLYSRCGSIELSEERLKKAYERYYQCYEIDKAFAEEAVEETKSIRARRNLAISCQNLGDIAIADDNDDDDTKTTLQWYSRYYAINKELAEETGTAEDRMGWAISCSKLGDIAKTNGDINGATKWYIEAYEISKALAEETGTAEAWRGVATFGERLGDITKGNDDIETAQKLYTQSYEISKALAEEMGTVKYLRDLAVSCSRLGNIAEGNDDINGATKWYTEAYKISKALYEATGTVRSRRDLAFGYERLGDIAKGDGDIKTAQRWYTEAYKISKALDEETRPVKSRRYLAIVSLKRGIAAQSAGDIETAKKYCNQSYEIFKAIAEKTTTVESRRDLAANCLVLENIAESEGDTKTAFQLYLHSYEIKKEIAEKTGNAEDFRSLANCCSIVGDIAGDDGDWDTAFEWYCRCNEIYRQLAEETRNAEDRNSYALSILQLGNAAEFKGDRNTALYLYNQYNETSRILFEDTGMPEALYSYAVSIFKIGNIEEACKDFQSARERYIKAHSIFLDLSEKLDTWNMIANCRECLSRVEESLGNKTVAEEHRKAAEEIRRRLQK